MIRNLKDTVNRERCELKKADEKREEEEEKKEEEYQGEEEKERERDCLIGVYR